MTKQNDLINKQLRKTQIFQNKRNHIKIGDKGGKATLNPCKMSPGWKKKKAHIFLLRAEESAAITQTYHAHRWF